MKYIIIPARGGSKGIPNKNLKKVSGISLVGWSVIHGKYISEKNDIVIVSSDSEEILQEAKKFGAQPMKRPKNLSGDKIFTEPVMDYVLSKFLLKDEDLIILLQPTSPLRYKKTLTKIIDAILKKDFDSSITLRNTHFFYWEKIDDRYIPLYSERPRRQDMKGQLSETGSVYVTKYKEYKKTGLRLSGKTEGVVVSDEEAVDIDNIVDLETVRSLSPLFIDDWKKEINKLGIDS